MRSPVGEGRERLLQALFDEFGETGPSPKLSMRQVAERLGVHHTLLTYHFGSRPGLLSAVLSEARRRDNLVIAAVGKDLGFAALCRAIWSFYSNAEHEDRSRTFFHLAGLAVYEHKAFQDFAADLDDLAHLLEAAASAKGSQWWTQSSRASSQPHVCEDCCYRGCSPPTPRSTRQPSASSPR